MSSVSRLHQKLVSKLSYSRKSSLDGASTNKPMVAFSQPPSTNPAEIEAIEAVNGELRNIAARSTTFDYRNIVKAVKNFQFKIIVSEGSHYKPIDVIMKKHGYTMGEPSEVNGVIMLPCKPSSAEARRRSSPRAAPRVSTVAPTTVTAPSTSTNNVNGHQQSITPTRITPRSVVSIQQVPKSTPSFELPQVDIIVQNVSGTPIAHEQSSKAQQEIIELFQQLNFIKFNAVVTDLIKEETSLVKVRSAKTPIEEILLRNNLLFRSCTKSDGALHLYALPCASITAPLMCRPYVEEPVQATPTPKEPKKAFLRRTSKVVKPLSAFNALRTPQTTLLLNPSTFTASVSFEEILKESKSIGDEATSNLQTKETSDISSTSHLPVSNSTEEEIVASDKHIDLKLKETTSTTNEPLPTSPPTGDLSPATLSLIEKVSTIAEENESILSTASILKDTVCRKLNFEEKESSLKSAANATELSLPLIEASAAFIPMDVSNEKNSSSSVNYPEPSSPNDSGYSSGTESDCSDSTTISESASPLKPVGDAFEALEKTSSVDVAAHLKPEIAKIPQGKVENHIHSNKLSNGPASKASFGFKRVVTVESTKFLVETKWTVLEESSASKGSVLLKGSKIPSTSSKGHYSSSNVSTTIHSAVKEVQTEVTSQSPKPSTVATSASPSSGLPRRTVTPQRAPTTQSVTSRVTPRASSRTTPRVPTAVVGSTTNIRCNTGGVRPAVKSDKPKFTRNVWN